MESITTERLTMQKHNMKHVSQMLTAFAHEHEHMNNEVRYAITLEYALDLCDNKEKAEELARYASRYFEEGTPCDDESNTF